MKQYIQLDADSRIIAIAHAEENPDPDLWVECEMTEKQVDAFNDYLLVDGKLVHDPLVRQPIPVTTEEVLGILIEAQQDTMLPLIPDDIIERMESWFPEWNGEGHAYEVGNIVSYGWVLYRCIQAHTSQQGWNPVDAASLWAKVLTDPDVPQPWEQPSSTNPYMKGDRVTHVGHTWVSDIDNNVWEPGVYGWTAED